MSLWKCFRQNCFWPLLFLVLLGLAQMFWPGGKWRNIEQDVSSTVVSNLKSNGMDWVKVDTHDRGRDVLLSGSAPSEEAKNSAMKIASELSQDKRGNAVASSVEWQGEIVIPEPNPGNLSFSVANEKITLNGVVSSEQEVIDLVAAADEKYGAANVSNRLVVKDNIIPLENIKGLVQNLNVGDGTLSLSSEKVLEITGVTDSEQTRKSIGQGLLSSLGSNYSLDNRLTVNKIEPEPGNLLFSIVSEKITLNGVVSSEQEVVDLVAAADEKYGETNVTNRLVVKDNIIPLNNIKGLVQNLNGNDGTLNLSLEKVLKVTGTTDSEQARESIGQGLLSSLDSNYSLDNRLTVNKIEPESGNLLFSTINGKITLNGVVSSEKEVLDLVAAADEKYGAANVTNRLVVKDNIIPLNNIKGLVQNLNSNNGTLRLSLDKVLKITGETDSNESRESIGQGILNTLGSNYSLDNRLTVKLPEPIVVPEPVVVPEPQPDLSAICQAKVLELLSSSKILFASGKAQIKAESYPLLNEIAAVLNECQESSIEVAGHTDNTGNEQINRPLSQNRAKAVVDYLTTKGIDTSRLSAIGFGSEQPIAGNNTRDGRAANRRIELTVK